MNILFANYHDFSSNSAIHIFHLANELVTLGHECVVATPGAVESVTKIGTPLFRPADFASVENLTFSNGHGVELIHAWTPREIVRKFVQPLAQKYACPYIVHLEDNEELLLSETLRMATSKLRRMSDQELLRLIPTSLSHPRHYQTFLKGASGVTALIDRLLEFKPDGMSGSVLWPSYDPHIEWHRPKNKALANKFGLTDEHVLVYTGNVHAANQREVFSLYLAVALLNRRGIRTKLLRTGRDYVPLFDDNLAELRNNVIELGFVERNILPDLLALADVLVQPGRAGLFNDYRFPSKLPEFLASGKPVVLPKSNIGLHLDDGVNAILLKEGNALEIVNKVAPLLADENLRTTIGQGGRTFAERHLGWTKNAKQLQTFYQHVLGNKRSKAAS